jgi:hypothetical protein
MGRTHGELDYQMPEPEETPAKASILFCPYCGDGFEGRTECPEHELLLVPIDRLPRRAGGAAERVVFFADPRFSRGPILFGAMLVLIGFFGPWVEVRRVVASALEVAIDGALNLWFAPGAALVVLWILWARRSRLEMRAARLALLGLAVAGAMPLAYTMWRIGRMAQAAGSEPVWRWGVAVMLLGFVSIAFGSARVGGNPPEAPG